MTKNYPRIVNRPLLLQTLARIEARPETWEQSNWATVVNETNFCGTVMCFAGHALAEEGFVPDFSFYGNGTVTGRFVQALPNGKPMPNGDVVFAESEATMRLGLTSDQACELFAANNTLEDIREHVFSLLGVDDNEQARELDAENA